MVNNSTASDSTAIARDFLSYDQLAAGNLSDIADSESAIELLNSNISCGDNRFELGLESCSNDNSCLAIFNTAATYTAPNCSNTTTNAQQLFDNLHLYSVQERAWIASLEQAVRSDPNSLQTLNTAAQNSLLSIQPSVAQLEATIPNTLTNLDGFNRSFKPLVDCRVLRKQSLQMEYHGCYKFN